MSGGSAKVRSSRFQERFSRLPIRVRLTLIFAVAMLFVLALSGAVVFERVRSDVDSQLDLDVTRQAASLLARVAGSPSGLVRAVAHPEPGRRQGVAQVLDRRGRVLAATPGFGSGPLLSRKQLRTALRHRLRVNHAAKAPDRHGLRLVTTPVRVPGYNDGVLVVGTALDQRAASLSSLALSLAIVGPVALLVVVGIGYRLTKATLRPVELMQRQASTVSAAQLGLRLPLPVADDEIRELGMTLNEMLGRLEESFAREQAFVANAGHELRTPLANLKVELDLALRRPRPADELVEALRSVQDEVDRLSDLADDLLILARADEGRLPITSQVVVVDDLLAAVRGRLGSRADRVRLIEAPGLRMSADPQRIEQALSNMLDNAVRYGGGEVVVAGERGNDGSVQLHVRDRGPGFPTAFIEHAFERFSRADPGRSGRGAGLGLSIVRMIARAHGGDAHAANREEGGADVWVVIPESQDE